MERYLVDQFGIMLVYIVADQLLIYYFMFLKATPKEKPVQFTPAIQKLFNRVLARVYRGSNRKKCSKERLLSLQHTQLVKKSNHPMTIVTSRPANHTLSRRKQFVPERSNYTEYLLPQNHEMKKFSSYHSQRSTDGSYVKPERCRTDANKIRDDDDFLKNPETGLGIMIHSELLSGVSNKIHQTVLKNRPSLRPNASEKQQNDKIKGNHSQITKQVNVFPCRIRQLESRRKINTIIKTKNKLESQLIKNNHKHLFEPWEVEQNDDLFF